MSSVNKFLSKLNQATTAIKSVKGISSKIFGTGYQKDLSKEKQNVEEERQRLQNRAKVLKSKNTALNAIPKFEAKMFPDLPSTELIYPKDYMVDNYIHFEIEKRQHRDGSPNVLSDKNVDIYLYAPNVPNNSPNLQYRNMEFGNVARSMIKTGFLPNMSGVSAEVQEMMQRALNKIALDTLDFGKNRAFNPQKEIMFEGMDFRTYDMSFQFRPNSKEEANEVNDIIWCFKTAMLPDTFQHANNNAGEFSENYFNLPNNVKISWEGLISNKMDGFLDSFITGCNVSYNGGNKMEMFEDGQPLLIEMQLSFMENILMTQENYQNIAASSRAVEIKSSPSARTTIAKEEQQQKEIQSQLDKSIGGSQTSGSHTAIDGVVFKDGKIVYQPPFGRG